MIKGVRIDRTHGHPATWVYWKEAVAGHYLTCGRLFFSEKTACAFADYKLETDSLRRAVRRKLKRSWKA